jgi:TonB-dependent starch-binding outer membrane protein SusC
MRSSLLRLALISVGLTAYMISTAGTGNNNYKFRWQQTNVHGTVKDAKGNPVADATVSVKGTNRSTLTATDGSFSIDAKAGDVLVITHVSYGSKELTVGSATVYDISLSDNNATLSDVVVVGYGKSSRKNLSSSISSVKPEEFTRGVISDVGQLLQGKVAGLNISSSGDPNRGAAVILRGASTINSPGGPFYVIDGVPGADIALIAPDDIASVDVLKDAAATAIYGNKAANGVIMITTKRGKKGRLQTTYTGNVGVETVSSKLKLMDAAGIRSYIAANNSSFSPSDDLGANTDWMSAIQRSNAFSQNHNISFSGGTEKSTYSASINYLNKEGILLKSKLDRVIARLAIDQLALNDRVKFGLNISNSFSNATYVPLQNVVLLQAARHLPISPVYKADGSYFENFNTTGYFNPVSLINNAQDNSKYSTFLGGFTTEAKLPFNLTYNLNISYQKTNSLHGEYYNKYYSDNYKAGNFYNNPDPGIGVSHWLISSIFGTNGAAVRNAYESQAKNVESYLTWDKKINKHGINAVIGYSWQENINGDGFQATNTNFVSDYTGYQNLGLGNYQTVSGYAIDFGGDNYSKTRFISDFGRLNYNYDDRYLLQASVRRDGSSVFGANKKWGYFPAIGLAWRINQEKFMQSLSAITDLKLRASYGITGNALGFGAYTAQQLFVSQGTYYNAGNFDRAIGVSQGSNPDLQWEKTETKNIGVDFGLFNGRLSGSLDVYEKVTSNMIFNYSVSTTIVPGGRIFANGGKMSNKGIELVLNATPVKTKDFSWNTNANFAINKNVIVDMNGPSKYGVNTDSVLYSDPEGPGQTNSTLQILKVGRPLGQFFTLVYAGKDANGNSQFQKHDHSLTTTPAIRTDYFYVGSPQPKLLMGWSNTFKYKNFDLNMFVRGVFGNKIFNATRADLSYTVNAAVNNISSYASGDKMTDSRNNSYSTRYIENGSYVRFDNLTLGYLVKLNNPYVTSLRLYTTVNNLAVITKYKGIDPEINMGGASPGIDYNNFYPKTRTVMLGVSVNF